MTLYILRIVIILSGIALISFLVYLVRHQEKIIFPGWIEDTGKNKGPLAETVRPEDINFQFIETPDRSLVEVWTMETHCQANESSPPPLAFIFGGNGSRIEHAHEKMSFFQDMCIDSIALEYSGFGRSTGKPGEEFLYRNVDTLLEFAKRNFTKFEDRKKIVLGTSLGGGPATYLAEKLSPDALILLSSFSSLPDAAADTSIIYRLLKPFIRHQFPNAERLKQLSGVCIILAHDVDDDVVPYKNLQRLLEASPSESNTVDAITTRGHGHIIFSAIEPELRQILSTCLNK